VDYVVAMGSDGSGLVLVAAFPSSSPSIGGLPVWAPGGDDILLNLPSTSLRRQPHGEEAAGGGQGGGGGAGGWSVCLCPVADLEAGDPSDGLFAASGRGCRAVGPCGAGQAGGVGLPLDPKGERSEDTGLVVAGVSAPSHSSSGSGGGHLASFVGLARPGASPLRLLLPHDAALAMAKEVQVPEVELLQVMTAAPRRMSASSASSSASSSSDLWRCDLFPAFDSSFRWVAFHGRPDGKRRQVLVSYLGDPAELWMLGVQL
jgi:hypothetical protein